MAKYSDKEVEQIVSKHLGKKRSVKRVDEEELVHDSVSPDADLGTPGLETVRSKYLGDWHAIYQHSTDAPAEGIDYAAGEGEDIADEIVQVPVSDDDESGPSKSFIVSGNKRRVIGTQG